MKDEDSLIVLVFYSVNVKYYVLIKSMGKGKEKLEKMLLNLLFNAKRLRVD